MMVATLLEPHLADLRDAIQSLDGSADAFEVRFDALQEPALPTQILKLTRKPLIATVRRPADGGTYQGPEDERLRLLESCLQAGFRYADVEAGTSLPVPEDRLIRSLHDLKGVPALDALLRLAAANGRNGAIFKFAGATAGFPEVLRLLEAAAELRRRRIRFALMGLGDFPRPLMHLLGSELVYGGGRRPAPGQPSLDSIRRMLHHWGDPAPATDLYLVVGDPIDHSLSPRLHNAAFQAARRDATYGALRVPDAAALKGLVDAALRIGLKGLNVTTPLKDAAYELVSGRTREAEVAQAANTIRFTDQGPRAHNTDGMGAARIVRKLVGSSSASILVAGTGGAGRAIAAALSHHRVTLAGRSADRLEKLARHLGATPWTLDRAAERLSQFDLLINATRIEEPFPLGPYKGALFDLHYGPKPTPWERWAAKKRLPLATGRQQLLAQAVLAHEFWTGAPAPEAEMKAALEAAS